MTTYQDPPLHSRRAARQGERVEAEGTASTPEVSNGEPLSYATTSRPPLPQYDGNTLRPRRAAEPADAAEPVSADADRDIANDGDQGFRSRDYSPEGRRAASSWSAPYGGVGDDGTVEFQTQGRAEVAPVSPPADEAASPIAPSEPSSESAAAGVAEHAEHTMTRRELRALREAGLITDVTDLSQPIPVIPPHSGAPVEVPVVDTPAVEIAEVPAAEVPMAEVPMAPVEAAPVEASPADAPAAVAPFVEPIPLVAPSPFAPPAQPSSRLDSALAEFDALAAGREPVVLPTELPAPASGRRSAGPVEAEPTRPVEPVVEVPVAEAPVAEAAAPEAPKASVSPDVVAPAFAQPEPLPPSTEGLSAFDALFQPPSAAIPVVVALPVDQDAAHHDVIEAQLEPETTPADPLLTAPAPQGAPAQVPPPPSASPYPTPVDLPAPPATPSPSAVASAPMPIVAPPPAPVSEPDSAIASVAPLPPVADAAPVAPTPSTVGHWSTQAEIDDAEQLNESTISRSVGAGNGAITTSALVLPSVPDHPITGPMGEGGEIMLTGSISLPDSLSITGAHPSQLDESDIDHVLDPGDHQVASTDSAPVRAIRAVSTHTASGGIISPTKPKGTRGFTVLIIAASAMAVVVVGLLIAGLVSGTL